MSDKPAKSTILLRPPDSLDVPPYANATFTFATTQSDVSVVFMRIPLLRDDQAKNLRDSGTAQIECPVVASITLPRKAALELANSLKKLLEAK